jgi:hypothetical protein
MVYCAATGSQYQVYVKLCLVTASYLRLDVYTPIYFAQVSGANSCAVFGLRWRCVQNAPAPGGPQVAGGATGGSWLLVKPSALFSVPGTYM